MGNLALREVAELLAAKKRIPIRTARRHLVAGLWAGELIAQADHFDFILSSDSYVSTVEQASPTMVLSQFWEAGHAIDGSWPKDGRWPSGTAANWTTGQFRASSYVQPMSLVARWPQIASEVGAHGSELIFTEIIAVSPAIDQISVQAWVARTSHTATYKAMAAGVGRATREKARDREIMKARLFLAALSHEDVMKAAGNRSLVRSLLRSVSDGLSVSEQEIHNFATILISEAEALSQLTESAGPPSM